jgi:hypothetical protein
MIGKRQGRGGLRGKWDDSLCYVRDVVLYITTLIKLMVRYNASVIFLTISSMLVELTGKSSGCVMFSTVLCFDQCYIYIAKVMVR